VKVTIIHNRIRSESSPDDKDVLDQAKLVSQSLFRLGHQADILEIGEDIYRDLQKIMEGEPDLVFNLVESVFDRNELLYIVPALLKAGHIPFTGASVEALFLTTHKTLAKKQMKQSGIPTPGWFDITESYLFGKDKKYILKPTREDGSVNLEEDAVFKGNDPQIQEKFSGLNQADYFIEEYIDGREFNISLLAVNGVPEVLPAAEIIFLDYPPGKERVIGYKAKWDQDSFEYRHTVRKFHNEKKVGELILKMNNIALQCWTLFGLKGYARVDFRVDRDENPYVLEINANPCISPDSGYMAAAREAGYAPENIIDKLLADLN